MKTQQSIINDILRIKGISAAELARKANMHSNSIYNLKNGSANASLNQLRRICNSVNIEIDIRLIFRD